jgi:hypothetical protein
VPGRALQCERTACGARARSESEASGDEAPAAEDLPCPKAHECRRSDEATDQRLDDDAAASSSSALAAGFDEERIRRVGQDHQSERAAGRDDLERFRKAGGTNDVVEACDEAERPSEANRDSAEPLS